MGEVSKWNISVKWVNFYKNAPEILWIPFGIGTYQIVTIVNSYLSLPSHLLLSCIAVIGWQDYKIFRVVFYNFNNLMNLLGFEGTE